jgi:hypothetical protein
MFVWVGMTVIMPPTFLFSNHVDVLASGYKLCGAWRMGVQLHMRPDRTVSI